MDRMLERLVSVSSILALALVLLAAVPGRSPGDAAAVGVVDRLHVTFTEILRDADKLGYKGRYQKLEPVIRAAYDMEFMARGAIGLAWKDLAKEQQDRWVATFGDLTVANYAGRMNRFTGQKFEVVGEEPAANDTVMIRTRVIDPAAENVDLAYRLRKSDAGWKVIDVFAKGTVSELALRRSEYTTVLKRDGFDALVASVRQKIADLEAGKVAP